MAECYICGTTQLVIHGCNSGDSRGHYHGDTLVGVCNKNSCSVKCFDCGEFIWCTECWGDHVKRFMRFNPGKGEPIRECAECAEEFDDEED